MTLTKTPAKLALGLLWRTFLWQIACGFLIGIIIGLSGTQSPVVVGVLMVLASILSIWLGVHTNNPKEANQDGFSRQTLERTAFVFILWAVGEVINLIVIGLLLEAHAAASAAVVGFILCYGFIWLAGRISYATMPIKFLPPKTSKKAQVQA